MLENERISAETAEKLKPIQFTKKPGVGRSGFYPHRVVAPSQPQVPAENDDGNELADD